MFNKGRVQKKIPGKILSYFDPSYYLSVGQITRKLGFSDKTSGFLVKFYPNLTPCWPLITSIKVKMLKSGGILWTFFLDPCMLLVDPVIKLHQLHQSDVLYSIIFSEYMYIFLHLLRCMLKVFRKLIHFP